MRTLLVFLAVIAVPAFVLVTLILVLSPLVFGDGIPRRDQASGQDAPIALTARAEPMRRIVMPDRQKSVHEVGVGSVKATGRIEMNSEASID